jgi:23S rRNA pseudouridine1911/1915/1917 synthase
VSETILVPVERAGLELDEFLCLHFPEFGKGFLRQAVREGRILLDGMRAQPSVRLRADQVLSVDLDDVEPPPAPVAPEAELPILHEDGDLLVVDKPAGLAVEPERWARGAASLAGALLALARVRGANKEDEESGAENTGPLALRLRAVHRLDKDTSGVLVVAKHIEAERFLRAAFEHDEVEKTYLALVEGEHPLGDGAEEVVDLALGPDPKKSGRMVVDPAGKPSRTRLAVEQRFRGFTWMRCRPETGRTHQIRVHLSASGFPLAVDPVYGRRSELALSAIKAGYRAKRGQVERPLIARLTLHAAEIRLPAPSGGAPLTVAAPLPTDLARLLKQLAKVRPFSR